MGLAKLAIANGDAKTAEAQSRQASESFGKFLLVDQQGDALNTLAQALIAEGRLADGRTQLDRAERIGVQDAVVKISLAVTAAKLDAQTGNAQETGRLLATQLADAQRMKLLKPQLEIRLAKVQIDKSPDNASAESQLEAIRRDAESAGYRLIATYVVRTQSGPPK